MQYQFVRKKQMVHPAVPNSDTLVDVSMIGYSIHTDLGSPKFLGEEHVSYCKTVGGPDILCNVIFFGICYILPNQHIFREYIIFIIGKMYCDRVKWLRRSDLAHELLCREL